MVLKWSLTLKGKFIALDVKNLHILLPLGSKNIWVVYVATFQQVYSDVTHWNGKHAYSPASVLTMGKHFSSIMLGSNLANMTNHDLIFSMAGLLDNCKKFIVIKLLIVVCSLLVNLTRFIKMQIH